jgi:galactokinase
VESFEKEIAAHYHDRFHLHPTVIRCVPSAGAGLVAE